MFCIPMPPPIASTWVPPCTLFFFSSRRRHTRLQGDWSSDVCSSDLEGFPRRLPAVQPFREILRSKFSLGPESFDDDLSGHLRMNRAEIRIGSRLGKSEGDRKSVV